LDDRSFAILSAYQQSIFGDEDASESSIDDIAPDAPLAARMRPRSFDEMVGQQHVLGPDTMLRKAMARGERLNLIVYGPPGTGKTTLAEIVTRETRSHIIRLNAVASNVAELREVLKEARNRHLRGKRSLLFIDEIHRFNKSQQDLLLPDVERGTVTLIGATTHNPGFYVNPPLLSRCHLIRLEPLDPASIAALLGRALEDRERGLGQRNIQCATECLLDIANLVGGDLRQALNTLQLLAGLVDDGGVIDESVIGRYAAERRIRYDADEDEHYDTASAYIKSMRGGDPDAALYWLAKMLEGGEDPRFIARRLVILASEDVGMADSRALLLAMAAFQACEVIGRPECDINLAHVTVFLATCPKSNCAYEALNRARAHLREHGVQPVPLWLRDKGGAANKRLGNAKDYRYSHEYPDGISGQYYMDQPEQFYFPKTSGAEAGVAERLERWRQLRNELSKAKKG